MRVKDQQGAFSETQRETAQRAWNTLVRGRASEILPMRTQGAVILLIAILIMAMAAVAVLVGDIPSQTRQDARSAEFQRLVRGLGLGPATDLSRCSFSFDPRLSFSCPEDHGPIPCGSWFCPHHACSVFYYPALQVREGARDGENP